MGLTMEAMKTLFHRLENRRVSVCRKLTEASKAGSGCGQAVISSSCLVSPVQR